MALSAETMADAIKAKLLEADPPVVAEGAPLDSLASAIAEAVVERLIADAVVTIPAGVAVSGGETSEAGIGGIT